jgi:hypothetical protein
VKTVGRNFQQCIMKELAQAHVFSRRVMHCNMSKYGQPRNQTIQNVSIKAPKIYKNHSGLKIECSLKDGLHLVYHYDSMTGLEFYRGNRRRGRTKCRGSLRQRRQFFAV